MSAPLLWIWVLGIHPHVKGTATRKLLVWACPQSRQRIYTHPSGAGLPSPPAAYGVHSPADAPALTSQGSDFLSPFPRPAKAGRMVGVAQRKSSGLQSRMPRVRIPPRPPGAQMPHRCQKWESPNLSNADSRQRPPAGALPSPAVIWGSSLKGRAPGGHSPARCRFESGLPHQRQSHVWCMARGYALPGRLDPANHISFSTFWHPGKTGPRRAESRYQPQGRTMRLARRVRSCRCKNQRGWAREFLTGIDSKNRDALRRL